MNPVGAPTEFPAEVAKACGRYYTTGIPEDTKALRAGALSEDQFLSQVRVLEEERIKQYRYALKNFDQGFLFFYFGHVDQLSHIFWRDRDPGHPAHDPEEAKRYGTVIDDAYVEMDALLGEALETLDDDDTLIVMSDHGFTSFRHGLNLNTWLKDNGYLTIADESERDPNRPLDGVDWSQTKAYALGLNALYINLAGRERNGSVQGAEKERLLQEIGEKLVQATDPSGSSVVDRVYIVEKEFPGADPQIAPDMLVGLRGYVSRQLGHGAGWDTG